MSRYASVNKGSECSIIAGDTKPLEIVHGATYAFGTQPGHAHQFVCGDTFVGIRIDECFDDSQQLLSISLCNTPPLESGTCFLYRAYSQRRWKYLYPVFLPGQQYRFF